MRLRQLFEAPSKVAVIGYGRMNPPTIGHSVLVNAINAKAKKYGGNPMLFLSMTHLAKGSEKSYLTPTGKTNKHFQTAGIKNPLDWKTKLGYAQKFFDIPISTDPSLNTIMSVMKHLENKGYEKVVLVCGSDRVREFETQILPYNNTADQSGNINFNIKEVSVEEGGFRDEEANDASGMSASKMRDAAAQDDFETFKQGVPDQSVAQQMFDDVRRGLGFEHQQEEMKEEPVTEYVQAIGPIVAGLKYGKYALKIIKWIYRNKWSIAFFTAGWKTVKWISDAIAWFEKYLNHPIAQALVKFTGPAIIVAVALYGGRKLYLQLVEMDRDKLSTEEMRQRLLAFKHDPNELAGLEKEMESGTEQESQQMKEGNLVLNKASLVPHIKNVIMDYLDQEDDVEKLSRILKMMVGKEVHAHGKRYRIESADITEAFNNIQTEVAGPKKCWPKFKKAGTQAGTGKNKGKRVNKCVPK
tara:strand:- start:40 stop:1446 length:1407 start_codon:yes stop_codon:yes gene_type:complete